MKKMIFILCLILPLIVSSQDLKKTFLTILDEYVEKEIIKEGFNKNTALLYVTFDKIENDFSISIAMYEFKHYPIVDSLKTYNGVKLFVRYPKDMKKKLSKSFKKIKDIRKTKQKKGITTISINDSLSNNLFHNHKSNEFYIDTSELKTKYESTSNFTFQLNKNNEIYIIWTSEDTDGYYYGKFKEKKLKFKEKKLKFSKDLKYSND